MSNKHLTCDLSARSSTESLTLGAIIYNIRHIHGTSDVAAQFAATRQVYEVYEPRLYVRDTITWKFSKQ